MLFVRGMQTISVIVNWVIWLHVVIRISEDGKFFLLFFCKALEKKLSQRK